MTTNNYTMAYRSRVDNFGPMNVLWSLTHSSRFIKANPKPHLIALVATKETSAGYLWVASNVSTKQVMQGYGAKPTQAKTAALRALLEIS